MFWLIRTTHLPVNSPNSDKDGWVKTFFFRRLLTLSIFMVCLWCGRTGRGGRADGRTVTWLPKFLGWVDYHILLAMGLRSSARALSYAIKYHQSLREKKKNLFTRYNREIYNHVRRKRQTSASYWQFFKIGNIEIKAVETNAHGWNVRETTNFFCRYYKE